MNIGVISTFPPEKCGIAIYTDNLLSEMNKSGDKSIKIIRIGTEESDADYKLDLKSFDLKKNLKKIIKEENLDLIHVEHNYPHFSTILNMNLISSLGLDVPFVITLHEVQYPQKLSFIGQIRFSFLKFIEKMMVKAAKKIIVHTPNQKEFLEREYNVKNVETIYHGLDLRNDNKGKEKNILFLGIITPAKGVHYLIEAMKGLKDYNLTIAGSIPSGHEDYEKELNEKIKENGLINVKTDFRWIPEKDKWNYYEEASLAVLPYTWAPYQSGILHNALSVGIPAVVTKTGALWELVEQFKFGEIAKTKDPDSIREAIKKVFENYDYYKEGICKYRDEANWENVAKKHINLYKGLIGK